MAGQEFALTVRLFPALAGVCMAGAARQCGAEALVPPPGAVMIVARTRSRQAPAPSTLGLSDRSFPARTCAWKTGGSKVQLHASGSFARRGETWAGPRE